MVSSRFEPLSYMLLNGLPDLAFEAWGELESEHKDVAYSPDWEKYQRMEDADSLRFVALRDGTVLIGYASILIEPDSRRSEIVVAYLNDIFLTQAKRGHAARFVKYIEKQLSGIGVRRIVAAERTGLDVANNAGRFYEILGFKPQERIWSKALH